MGGRNGNGKTPAGPRVRVFLRSYKVPLPDEARSQVAGLITWYVNALNGALAAIWENTTWEGGPRHLERYGRYRVPRLPSGEFIKRLRKELVAGCPYSTHWVDSVINAALRIMKSWRRRYLKGRARRARPKVTRRFAIAPKSRVKVDYESKMVRVTLRPGEYVVISWAGAWFAERVDGWEIGEPIIRDDAIILVFKKRVERSGLPLVIAFDSNENSLDGFDGQRFITVDLKPLVRMKEHYEEIIARLQRAGKEELAKKYRRRLRNRERDFLNKLAITLTEKFAEAIFAFEYLDKEDLVSREKPKSARRRNHRVPWLTIQRKVGERAPVVRVSPRNTSRTCPRCGWVSKKDPGRVFKCGRCGLEIDRQKLAAINIWRRAMKKIFGREPDLPPRFWELPELRLEVRL
ncbi:MAG: zinc ribbon domain-containing protein [Thermofilaceae archaeon]